MQDRAPLTRQIAELPDSSLRSQVFIQTNEMKDDKEKKEDLLEAKFTVSIELIYFMKVLKVTYDIYMRYQFVFLDAPVFYSDILLAQ